MAPTERPHQLMSAWGISLCVHALIVVTAAGLLRELPQLPPPTYRMELLLHESSHAPSPHSSAAADTPSASKDRANQPQAAPVMASPQHKSAASSAQPIKAPVDRTPSVVQQTPTQVTTVTRVAHSILSSTAVHTTTPMTTSQPIEQRIESSPTANEFSALTPQPAPHTVERSLVSTTAPTLSPPASREVVTERQERSIAQVQQQSAKSAYTPLTHSGQAPASPHGADGTDGTEADTDSPSSDATQHNAKAGAAASAPTPSSHAEEAKDPEAPDAPHAVVAMGHPSITRTISAGSDFGWLTDLLKRRIKSFQAYPRLAAMQGWEGKVVVQATIGQDGRLLSAVVTESSGFASLDQDALTLMHRATPIHFQQELGQTHIDVFIPVIYHLNR
ncbi:MAG: TonB family protein [Nitrospira sp.]|nr:MAG: TonB family protein [Nitrospira sp.]